MAAAHWSSPVQGMGLRAKLKLSRDTTAALVNLDTLLARALDRYLPRVSAEDLEREVSAGGLPVDHPDWHGL